MKRKKGKKNRKSNEKRNSMRAKFCTDKDTTLISGLEYQVNAVANVISNQSLMLRQELKSPLTFKVVDNSTKYILMIKKRPRSPNVTSEAKLKLKAIVRSCEMEDNNNATNEGNGADRNRMGIEDEERNLKGNTQSAGGGKTQNRRKQSGGKNKNKRNKNSLRNSQSYKGKNTKGQKDKKEENKSRRKSRGRNKKNNVSKNFRVRYIFITHYILPSIMM